MLTVLLATGRHFRVSLICDDNNYIYYIHLFFTVLVNGIYSSLSITPF